MGREREAGVKLKGVYGGEGLSRVWGGVMEGSGDCVDRMSLSYSLEELDKTVTDREGSLRLPLCIVRSRTSRS